MRTIFLFVVVILLFPGCAGQRPLLPVPKMELETADEFFAKPPGLMPSPDK